MASCGDSLQGGAYCSSKWGQNNTSTPSFSLMGYNIAPASVDALVGIGIVIAAFRQYEFQVLPR